MTPLGGGGGSPAPKQIPSYQTDSNRFGGGGGWGSAEKGRREAARHEVATFGAAQRRKFWNITLQFDDFPIANQRFEA